MVTWYWSVDNLIRQVSIDHNMMSYIKKVQGKPRLILSVNLLFGWWLPSWATPLSRAIPLTMIATRKSIHGFPLVSYMGIGLRLATLRAARALLLKHHSILHLKNGVHNNDQGSSCMLLMRLDVCPPTWSVPRSDQFCDSLAQGKLSFEEQIVSDIFKSQQEAVVFIILHIPVAWQHLIFFFEKWGILPRYHKTPH